jgi:hypothetical protein
MNIGDKVWFFGTDMGRSAWGDDYTVLFPRWLDLLEGIIVDTDLNTDCTYVYVKGETELVSLGHDCDYGPIFKSKDAAIDAMISRLSHFRGEE